MKIMQRKARGEQRGGWFLEKKRRELRIGRGDEKKQKKRDSVESVRYECLPKPPDSYALRRTKIRSNA
jgi:hypothetical protein